MALRNIMRKRAPLKILKESYKESLEILRRKGLILPQEKSLINTNRETNDKVILPGLPEYLPHKQIINFAKLEIIVLIKEWLAECRKKKINPEIFNKFINFVNTKFLENRRKDAALVAQEEKNKTYDIKVSNKKDTRMAIMKFIVDSWAVAIIKKQNKEVSGYLFWFDDWCEQLLKFWKKPITNG